MAVDVVLMGWDEVEMFRLLSESHSLSAAFHRRGPRTPRCPTQGYQRDFDI